ncbi:hypothetical protein AEI23_09440 [Campylobacter jejuni]|nr:hypothetical protein [Campylobacter jejuni]AXL46176.1 hypothetical protein AEI23_09440 [Campylobacter jejuni]
MHKPNSAIERIKNHLAYKLGKVMIDFSHQRNNYKYGGGYIALFKKLYKIKKQHKKEQKIYQQTIQKTRFIKKLLVYKTKTKRVNL